MQAVTWFGQYEVALMMLDLPSGVSAVKAGKVVPLLAGAALVGLLLGTVAAAWWGLRRRIFWWFWWWCWYSRKQYRPIWC
jgi:hypothetical protein